MNKLILTESQLINLIRKALISEQADVTDIQTYPACVQKFGQPEPSESGRQYSIAGKGAFRGLYFYNNGVVSDTKLKKNRKYSCEGDTILLDGQKNPKDEESYPECVRNFFISWIGEARGTGVFSNYIFYPDFTAFYDDGRSTKNDSNTFTYTCGKTGKPVIGPSLKDSKIQKSKFFECVKSEKSFSQPRDVSQWLIKLKKGVMKGHYDGRNILEGFNIIYKEDSAKPNPKDNTIPVKVSNGSCVNGVLKIEKDWEPRNISITQNIF